MTVALVLEGGGIRSAFTCGVLKSLLEENIPFSTVVGTSTGALCGAYYRAGQGDVIENIFGEVFKYLPAPSLKMMLNKKAFDLAKLFDTLTEAFPLDMEAFSQADSSFSVATTRADNGDATFWRVGQLDEWKRLRHYLKATLALPGIEDPVSLMERSYFSGDIAAALPIDDEFPVDKMIVVQTHPVGYVMSRRHMSLSDTRSYRPYPKLKNVMLLHHLKYNNQLNMLEDWSLKGKAHCIRPVVDSVKRYGSTEAAAAEFYTEGYRLVKEQLPRIKHIAGVE